MTAVSDVSSQWAVLLASALESLPQLFTGGRSHLGYLAATSKVENPARDAVAFFVHQEVAADGYLVAREWLHRDLAVLDPVGNPVALLEAKALYGFDVPAASSPGGYLTGMKSGHGKDAAILQPHAALGQECFLLSLVTHPMEHVPASLLPVIKYSERHNLALAKAGSAQQLFRQSQQWASDLTRYGPLACDVTHDLGKVYGIPFQLACVLIGPLPPQGPEPDTT